MADEMTDQELAEIEGRLHFLPPGPWQTDALSGARVLDPLQPINPMPFQDTNVAEFIAHAREDVPRLLAEVRRLRALLAEHGR